MAAILQSLFESRVLSLESGGTVIKQINLALLAVAKDRDGGEEKKKLRAPWGHWPKLARCENKIGTAARARGNIKFMENKSENVFPELWPWCCETAPLA